MPTLPPSLAAAAARRTCDPARFAFDTTAALPELSEVLGQPRAVAALEFGAGIRSHGFNLFALGQPGSGKTTLIREHLERRAAGEPRPEDLVYVNNFADARRPQWLRLPAGRAPAFKQELQALVVELQEALPRVFDRKEYTAQRDKLLEAQDANRREELTQLETYVGKYGFQLVKTPAGLLLAPVVNGAIISEAELEALTPEQREKLIKLREMLQGEIEEGIRRVRAMEKRTQAAVQALNQETALFAIRPLVDDLRARYAGAPAVIAYLDAVQADVVAHAEEFYRPRREPTEPEAEELPGPLLRPPAAAPNFTRYQVNVLVDNQTLTGAPVIVESNPTYHNLTGRIEHQTTWNSVATNFTLIKPGALHRANGGYLIIPARECLLNPYAWEGLKRALKDRLLRVEELGTQLSLLSAVTLEPAAVPLDVKVVLIGSPAIYYLLLAYDEDFQKLFKVKADFTTEMDRTAEAEQAYALFVSAITHHDQLLPFEAGAVARVVEYGSRAAGDQAKLTTRFGDIADLVREAAYRAAQHAQATVTAADVRAAEAARRFRGNLFEARLHEAVRTGVTLITTTGAAVGQVNGLSVLDLGDAACGHPVRITAVAGPGQRGVVSLEREVALSGPIHGKGVLILSGYLQRQYGAEAPLGLSASLVFEQSYGLVEGDSASLAELVALLSALARVPVRQSLAITGSINQMGQVQAVGGVTEKVEGFYEVCAARGLTGDQGVMLPAANQTHLMLRDEVVAAIAAGQFKLWVVDTVDAALTLATGRPAGARTRRGVFPAASLHQAVSAQLARFGRVVRAGERRR